MNTPEIITALGPNEIFVFGSNQFGRHGAGSAKAAVDKFGAIYGVPIGLCGQSYGIVTTSFNDVSIDVAFIKKQIHTLYEFAFLRHDLTFYVTKVGCGLAGFSIKTIGDIFRDVFEETGFGIPDNIILPIEFELYYEPD
jgi:hypothetical protein